VARRRLDINAAALALGISSDAVRKRAERGTLDSERDDRGHVWVWLDTGETDDQPRSESPDETLLSEKERRIEDLRDRVAYLERQVEEERDARRRADTLLARMMDRVPELEAPESRETGAHAPAEAEEGHGPGPVREEAGRGPERPWWRRILGG
jgi:chromosome segregation ATPase